MSTSSRGAVGVPAVITGSTGHPPDKGDLWRPSAPCSPRTCVDATGSARAIPLAAVRIVAVLFLLVVGFAASPLGGRIPAGLVRSWCRWVVRTAGVRVRVDGGAAPDGGLLLVANHVSWLDIPLLAAVRPARMLAKSEIRDWPVAGWLTARSGALFIDRDRIRALPETVARIAGALRAGEAVAVFPEGSTWCGRAQGQFRRAAFQAALDAGVPVQPVRLRYPSTAAAFVGDDSLLASVWRVARARELVAEVEVLEPITPDGRADRRSLTRAAEMSVLLGAREARVPRVPGQPRVVPRPAPGSGQVVPAVPLLAPGAGHAVPAVPVPAAGAAPLTA